MDNCRGGVNVPPGQTYPQVRLGAVRDPFEGRTGFVRGPFGIHSRGVRALRGSFGIRSGSETAAAKKKPQPGEVEGGVAASPSQRADTSSDFQEPKVPGAQISETPLMITGTGQLMHARCTSAGIDRL